MAGKRHVILAVSICAGLLLVFGGGILDFHHSTGNDLTVENVEQLTQTPNKQVLHSTRLITNIPLTTIVDQQESQNSNCYQLETIPNFEATMCYSSDSCVGSLSLVRQQCTSDPHYDRDISKNETTNSYLRNIYGPDWYRVRFWGPEVVVSDPHFVSGSGCKYIHNFELTSKGQYYLAVELLYKNFDGIDEIRNIWPPLLKTGILKKSGTRSAIQRKTSFHQGQLTEDSDVTLVCSSPTAESVASVGRWKLSSDKPLYTKVRSKKITRKPIVFQWLRQVHEDFRWSPSGTRQNGIQNTDRVSILVTGDSQLRAVYFGIVNTLRGHQADCVRNISSPNHYHEFLFPKENKCVENVKGSHMHKIGRFSVFFTEDTYLSKCKPGGKYGGYSVVVLGFGQHPASRKHWSLSKYERVLREKVNCIQSYLDEGKKIRWIMAPKYPDTRTGFPVGVKDWRTDPRLFIFNAAAREALPKHENLQLIESFNMTVGMGHTSSDQAHYNNFILAEFVNSIIGDL